MADQQSLSKQLESKQRGDVRRADKLLSSHCLGQKDLKVAVHSYDKVAFIEIDTTNAMYDLLV